MKETKAFYRGSAIHALFLFLPVIASAQVFQSNSSAIGVYNPLDNTNVPARVAAMGSAFVAVADNGSALFSNPAGLASLSKGEISLLSDFGWVGAFRETATVILPLGPMGGVGLAGGYTDYGSVTGRDEFGALAPSYGAGSLDLRAGWGRSLAKKLSAGFELRVWQQSLADTGYSFFTPELGVLFQPLANLRLGLDYAVPLGGTWQGSLVSTLKAGASWLGPLDRDFRLLAAVGGSFESNSTDGLQTGIEVSYLSRFFLRGGYQARLQGGGYEGLSLGAGVVLGGLILDYAYSPNGDLTDYHRFSLTYPFETGGGSSTAGVTTGTRSTSVSNAISPVSKAQLGANSPVTSTASVLATPTTVTPISQGPPPIGAAKPAGVQSAQDRLTLKFNIPADFTSQGDALEAQGHFSEAVPLYRQALQQDSNDLFAWWGLGTAYYKLGQKAPAITCFEKVLQLKPDNQALSDWLHQYQAQQH